MSSRLAVFSVLNAPYATVRDWADAAGHEIAALVTVLGEPPAQGIRDLSGVPAHTTVIGVWAADACRAALEDLAVDLGIVFGFPMLSEAIADLPRYGCVNLHPSLLPRYRGLNGYRSLYEGEPEIGATLHWITPETDAGAILGQASEASPHDIDPTLALEAYGRVAQAVLDEGVPRALAGEAGTPQDGALASKAPRFTEQEAVLGLELTTRQFQSRVTALVLAGLEPKLWLAGELKGLRTVRRLPGLTPDAPALISQSARRAIVAVADGVLELELGARPS